MMTRAITVLGPEPRQRHTQQCDTARGCGHPRAFCVCTELERLHEDWEALRDLSKYADLYLPANKVLALMALARSKAAIDDLHERIAAASRIEADQEGDHCPICRVQDGP